MGFIFLGTSIPDAFGSIAAAKAGQGNMAVANAIGSNVNYVIFLLLRIFSEKKLSAFLIL